MGFFSNIIDKIFHHSTQSTPAGQAPAGTSATAPANAPLQSVDVEKVLTDLAAKKGGSATGVRRSSIF